MAYTALILPYKLVFVSDDIPIWDQFEDIINYLFIMDLLVCMFSTTYDKSGLLVAERKVVIMSYVKGWFFFDMIACIPFDTILQGIFDESD
jgi:uncharacterized membrane protein